MEMNQQEKTNMPISEAQFQAILERIEASNAGQEKYARKQYRMSQLTALVSVIILAVVLYAATALIPRINTTFQNLDLIMEDLNTITSELAKADLEKMINDVDHLVVNSEENIQNALQKINAIDIDTLNNAISSLNDAVTPLANFFNYFN